MASLHVDLLAALHNSGRASFEIRDERRSEAMGAYCIVYGQPLQLYKCTEYALRCEYVTAVIEFLRYGIYCQCHDHTVDCNV